MGQSLVEVIQTIDLLIYLTRYVKSAVRKQVKEIFYILSIKSLKSVVHFVYPMHVCLDILPLKSSRAARLMATLLCWALQG